MMMLGLVELVYLLTGGATQLILTAVMIYSASSGGASPTDVGIGGISGCLALLHILGAGLAVVTIIGGLRLRQLESPPTIYVGLVAAIISPIFSIGWACCCSVFGVMMPLACMTVALPLVLYILGTLLDDEVQEVLRSRGEWLDS